MIRFDDKMSDARDALVAHTATPVVSGSVSLEFRSLEFRSVAARAATKKQKLLSAYDAPARECRGVFVSA